MIRFALLTLGTIANLWQASPAIAESSPKLQQLLESPHRPRMADVIRAVGSYPETNPYEHAILRDKQFDEAAPKIYELAQTIAYLEYAFPNAVWAPLGRDAVIFGEVLDAFYTSIGQPGRVARLNASTASFVSINTDDIVPFLSEAAASVGMDLRQLDRPFVILDRTSYRRTSQSQTLMRAAYGAYEGFPEEKSALLRKIGIVSLTSKRNKLPPSAERADFYFQHLRLSEGVPSETLPVPINAWTDTKAWHEPFPRFNVPGVIAPLKDRECVLGEMIWILQTVSSLAFVTEVFASARDMGYEFPLPTTIDRAALDAATSDLKERSLAREEHAHRIYLKLHASAQEVANNELLKASEGAAKTFSVLVKNLTPLSDAQLAPQIEIAPTERLMSRNGELLEREYDRHYEIHQELKVESGVGKMTNPTSNLITLSFISEVTQAFDKQAIHAHDFRTLIFNAFSRADEANDFYIYLGNILQRQPSLKKLMIEEDLFFSGVPFNAHERVSKPEVIHRHVFEALLKRTLETDKYFGRAKAATLSRLMQFRNRQLVSLELILHELLQKSPDEVLRFSSSHYASLDSWLLYVNEFFRELTDIPERAPAEWPEVKNALLSEFKKAVSGAYKSKKLLESDARHLISKVQPVGGNSVCEVVFDDRPPGDP